MGRTNICPPHSFMDWYWLKINDKLDAMGLINSVAIYHTGYFSDTSCKCPYRNFVVLCL